jgi:signal transduction histidine kinase
LKRLYIRVLLAALAAFMVGALVLMMMVLREREEDRRVVESSLHGGMVSATEAIRTGSDREGTLAELRSQYKLDMQVLPTTAMPPGAQARLRSGMTTYFVVNKNGFVAHPISAQEALRMGPLPEFVLPPLWELTLIFLCVSALFAAVLAIGLLPTLRGMRELERGAQAMALGNFGRRVDESGDLTNLALILNDLASKTQAHQALQAELLHAVSHELRTPLARLSFALEALPVPAAALHEAEGELDQLDSLVGELLAWSRSGEAPLRQAPVSLVQTLHSLAERYGASASGPSLHAMVDARLFERCVDNLVRNAQLHGSAPLELSWCKGGVGVLLHVDDAGPGLPSELQGRALEPFVQFGSAAGTGLGLAIASRCCQRHGGRLLLSRSPNGGLRATSDWPLTADPVQSDTYRNTSAADTAD